MPKRRTNEPMMANQQINNQYLININFNHRKPGEITGKKMPSQMFKKDNKYDTVSKKKLRGGPEKRELGELRQSNFAGIGTGAIQSQIIENKRKIKDSLKLFKDDKKITLSKRDRKRLSMLKKLAAQQQNKDLRRQKR